MPSCSCYGHGNIVNAPNDTKVYQIENSKKFKKSAIEYLKRENLLQSYHKCLCQHCYEYALQNSQRETVKPDTEIPKYTFEEFCEYISSDKLDDEQFCTLSGVFGSKLRQKLVNVKSSTEPSFLQNLNAGNQLGNINKCVLVFLNAIALNDSNKVVRVLNAYEHLVYLAMNNYIGSLNFAINLISHFLTGSRNIVELNSSYSPGGSYSFILNYLKKNSQVSLEMPSDNDITIFFDNNQIMARNWNVKYNSRALISVITTLICLVPPKVSNIQNNPLLKPSSWLVNIDHVKAEDDEKDKLFRSERNSYIQNLILDVKSEKELEKSGSKPKKPKLDSKQNPYDVVESNIVGKTDVKVLDPVMVNPCSYQSLAIVLDDILAKCKKEWVVIGCDGLPFILCSKLIENYHVCPTCKELFKKKEAFVSHVQVHPVTNINECKKYGNVLLIPGLGHMEINLTKAVFKLLWKVVLKEVALMLGWKTIKALTACEKCTDHHKAWQILQILFTAGSRAIVSSYIDSCSNASSVPSLNGLYSFYLKQPPNFVFLYKCVFTILFGLNLFRSSVRRGNFRMMAIALHKLSPLFYGLNMTSYMEIILRFENMLKKAPSPVLTFVTENLMCSQSGNESKAEGGDFILESVNKKIKNWMPPGVPTEDRWLRVCRNLPLMDSLKTNLDRKLEQSEDGSGNPYFRQFDKDEAVSALVTKLGPYLQQTENHVSLDGNKLDDKLVDFDIKCENNKKCYFEMYPLNPKICERVFVTPEDRHKFFDIQNRTKPEIQQCILATIKNIEDEGGVEESEILKKQFQKEIRVSTKDVHLSFYREVVQCLEEVSSKTACEGISIKITN